MPTKAEGDSAADHRAGRLLLVDGHAYAYRAFHAIGGLRGPDGRPTNAIFGFIRMLEKARSQVEPTRMAVVWDGGLDAERLESLPEYKGHRPEMPGDLEVQLDQIVAYLEAAGILSVCQEGVEADDLIATIAVRAARAEWNVVIATSDKDFMQLVSDRIRLLNPGDKTRCLWGESEVVEKTGVRPAQIVDWLCLVGDAVDNIPGVPGVGPRTSARLLQQSGSLEGIYGELDRMQPERLRSVLAGYRDAVFKNRSLVQLKMDLDSAPALEQCGLGQEDRRRLGQLCASWGFKTLARAYGADEGGQVLLL